jgi:hypothetical protein
MAMMAGPSSLKATFPLPERLSDIFVQFLQIKSKTDIGADPVPESHARIQGQFNAPTHLFKDFLYLLKGNPQGAYTLGPHKPTLTTSPHIR